MSLKKEQLLILLALLVGIKFAWLPFQDWKAQQEQQLEQLQARSAKTQLAIENREIYQQQINTIETDISKVSKRFGKLVTIEQAELDIQDWVKEKLKNADIIAIRSGWQSEFEPLGANVYQGKYRVTFSTSVYSMSKLLLSLEDSSDYMLSITNFSLSIQTQAKGPLDMGSGRSALELSFWIKTP